MIHNGTEAILHPERARVAIVGFGGIGALHAGILSSLPNCEVVAAVDRDERLVRIASKVIPSIQLFTDVEAALVKQRPNIVYLCTPVETHLSLTRDVLESPDRPSAIFVEKPLALSTSDAEEMASLASQHGTVTGVGFQRRFFPTIRKAKELLSEGAIGRLLLARCHHFAEAVFEPGEGWRFNPQTGGVTLELGVHLLDVMVYLFGEPHVVSGELRRMFSLSCDDYASAVLKSDQIELALFEVGWSMWGFNPADFRIEVYGTQGSLCVTQDELTLHVRPSRKVSERSSMTYFSYQLVGPLPILLGSSENVLIDMDFIQSVLSGVKPQVTFEDGVLVNRLVDRIRDSAQPD